MARNIDFSKPRKIVDPVFRAHLRRHKPIEWAELGFTVRPDGSKHDVYWVNLNDLLTWGAGLDEMRRRGYNAKDAEAYLLSVYQRYVPTVRQYFADVQEGQLLERIRKFCRENFTEEWPFD
ncbi:MAG: hypothetical protein KC441_00530 [Anaerolineales bacterium]|nr:hypothetical protein [Anaerolineales bacterium]